jgi:hypothetical protein
MKKLGFHSTWTRWIETCISSISFSILINGSSFGMFSPGRGLRQGDPLSLFLFILGSEALSRLLYREEQSCKIRGMKIARNNPSIHHLLFADDLLLFGKASISEATIFKQCLDKYCLWSVLHKFNCTRQLHESLSSVVAVQVRGRSHKESCFVKNQFKIA